MKIVHGTTKGLEDVATFVDQLDNAERDPSAAVNLFFEPTADLFITRAPGRLDVMGGIADYSGSLVLELPLAEATLVALQRDIERKIKIVSLANGSAGDLNFEMPLADFERAGRPIDYDDARRCLQHDPNQHWAAYVAGVFLVLMRECAVDFRNGARILISSNVPEGKGVSSSAALEVAVMQAVAAAFAIEIEPRELALLCQKVENLVVGAPCGVMDQMTSATGRAGRLLSLLCQPAEPRDDVPIPSGIAFWGLDSGVRHAVSGADYGSVRVGAFMGYRMIAEVAGFKAIRTGEEQVQIEDPEWGGYLANITPEEFENRFAPVLPETITGAEFLDRYQGSTDSVTRIDPDRTYRVRIPTGHPIYENQRTRIFSETLSCAEIEHQLVLLGTLMFESHASYSACGLGSDGTDLLVQLVREAGPAQGLYGAKITGGGSGGTVAVLGLREAGEAVKEVVAEYERRTGYAPHIFAGSSPGSAAFGHIRLSPRT